MNMIEAMTTRRSTRSFDGHRLTQAETEKLRGILVAAGSEAGPFGRSIRLALYESDGDGKPVKLGTYGLISGASAFIVAAVAVGNGAMEDAGYVLERAVLEATAAGWASCWIGGVFSRGRAAEIVGLAKGEVLPAVIALGLPAIRRSVADRIVTGAAKSRSRKALESLVFAVDGSIPDEPWLGVVQAMQGAPSASNKQPWRLVRLPDRDEWVIFMDEDRVYNNSLGEAHLQNLDIGIGMRHFREAAAFSGLRGQWMKLPAPKGGLYSEVRAHEGVLDAEERLRSALRYGEERGWIPIALWR